MHARRHRVHSLPRKSGEVGRAFGRDGSCSDLQILGRTEQGDATFGSFCCATLIQGAPDGPGVGRVECAGRSQRYRLRLPLDANLDAPRASSGANRLRMLRKCPDEPEIGAGIERRHQREPDQPVVVDQCSRAESAALGATMR